VERGPRDILPVRLLLVGESNSGRGAEMKKEVVAEPEARRCCCADDGTLS
jgi:hypothetical protein